MWRTLGEFSLHAVPETSRAAQRVAAIVHQLSVPPEFVERIGAAIARAMLNVTRRDDTRQTVSLVSIRVMVSADLAVGHSERGWGFFLISRMRRNRHDEPTSAYQIIELFLYPEGLST